MKKTLVEIILGALVGAALLASPAVAAPTSCDITTGASCFWNEGCDCDHDGYVRENGKSYKYCHWTKCPIDKNDTDPNVLGKPSEYNADGDAWTTDYDCDDSDACVANDCSNICGPEPTDDDDDGYPVGEDCDDTNPYIKPHATLACCSCDVLTVPSQAAAFGCSANPCPLGNTSTGDTSTTTDTWTATDTWTPADTWTPTDTASPAQDATPGVSDTLVTGSDALALDSSGGGVHYATPPVDPGVVGSGNVVHKSPPSPVGCAGGGGDLPGALVAGFGILLALVSRRRRAAKLAAAAAVVATLGASGCTTVRPWERGRLAKTPMIFGADGWADGLEQHLFQYREGAAGGFGGGGGGCGCN